MPEPTSALTTTASVGALVRTDGGDAEQVLARFTETGVDLDAWRTAQRRRRSVRKVGTRCSKDRVAKRRTEVRLGVIRSGARDFVDP
jgi:hypothetical protein